MSGTIVAVYRGPKVDNFYVNLNVVREPSQGLTLAQAQTDIITSLKRTLKVTNLSTVTHLKLAGENALVYRFDDTQGSYKLRQGQIVLIHAGYGYIITYSAPVAQFDKQSPTAVKLIKSIKFR